MRNYVHLYNIYQDWHLSRWERFKMLFRKRNYLRIIVCMKIHGYAEDFSIQEIHLMCNPGTKEGEMSTTPADAIQDRMVKNDHEQH